MAAVVLEMFALGGVQRFDGGEQAVAVGMARRGGFAFLGPWTGGVLGIGRASDDGPRQRRHRFPEPGRQRLLQLLIALFRP